MKIILLTLLTTVVYTISVLFTARASLRLPSNLAVIITNLVSVVLPVMVVLATKAKLPTQPDKTGIIYALLAGATIALFTMLLTYTFSKAENVSFIMPMVYGGAIVLGTVLGALMFGEKLPLVGLIGILLITTGIGFVIYARLHA